MQDIKTTKSNSTKQLTDNARPFYYKIDICMSLALCEKK